MITQNINIDTIRQYIKSLPRHQLNQLINELTREQHSATINNLSKHISEIRHSEHVICPHCGSIHCKKNGTVRGSQRFYCKDCMKYFAGTNETPFFRSQKDKDVWFKYIELMLSGVSVRKTGTICKMSKNTALEWRHKICNTLIKKLSANKLSGISEIDDTFFKFSFKGMKGMSINTHVEKKRGISNDLICYTTGVSRGGKVVATYNGMGKNSTDKMEQCFKNKVEYKDDTLLISDCEKSYGEFARNHNVKIIQSKAENHKCKGYKHVSRGNLNMNSVNSFHSMLKAMIKRTHGVGRKYLHGYIQWTAWAKQVTKLAFNQQISAMFNDLCQY